MTPGALPAEPWLPAACTLPTSRQPLRLAEFDELLAEAVTGVERPGRGISRLVLRPDPEVVARAAALCVRETRCCSFFSFSIRISDERVTLEVTVPPAQHDVLDALADRAEALTGTTERDEADPSQTSG